MKSHTEFADYRDPNGIIYITDPVRTPFATSGVLDISKLNPNTHRAEGSFTFVVGRSSTSGTSANANTHTVINGTFTGLIYYP